MDSKHAQVTEEHRRLIAQWLTQDTASRNDRTIPERLESLAQLLADALAAEAERVRRELTFEEFSRINRQRCEAPTGFNHQLSSWSTSDWFLAVVGELGEAANIAKKLNRVRDGIPGNKLSEAELRAKLRQEVGDTFVYLDLLCQACGISICEAAVEVFNAKSAELGCSIAIRALADQPRQGVKG